MASNELIIDDDYCKAMGSYFIEQGQQIDQIISEYILIMQELRDRAIVSGDTANALSTYINYVKKLNKQIGDISVAAEKQVDAFITAIDAADQYLF